MNRTRLYKLILILIPVLISMACTKTEPVRQPETGADPPAASAVWSIFRGDPGLSGRYSGAFPVEPELLWSFKTGEAVKSSPVVSGAKVFIGSGNGIVYALDRVSGKELWAFDSGAPVEASPLLLDGSLYIGSLDGVFYALDIESGQQRWSYTVEAQIVGSANHHQGAVLFGSYDGRLYSLDAESGALNWSYETSYFINGTPALYQDTVVFGGCDALLHLVSVHGSELGQIDTGAYIAGSPAISEGLAYIGNYGDSILAVDLSSRKILWEYVNDERGGAFFSSPAVSGDAVVIGSRDGRLHCLERDTGLRRWVYAAGSDVDVSPVIVGDRVGFGSSDGRLYMVRMDDGVETWRYEIGSPVTSSPALAAGMLFIGSDDGRLYAFGRK